jgi:hypothetical protein
MTYFPDLSEYTYTTASLTEKNVGWLSPSSRFDKWDADESFMDLLWRYCKFSVAQTRGIHHCELCPAHRSSVVERGDEKLVLGSAEVRIFSDEGNIYAAPNLIYHYVLSHHYCPPQEFIDAVRLGSRPESKEYLDRLAESGWAWTPTEAPNSRTGRRFIAVKTPSGPKIVER